MEEDEGFDRVLGVNVCVRESEICEMCVVGFLRVLDIWEKHNHEDVLGVLCVVSRIGIQLSFFVGVCGNIIYIYTY